MSVIRLSRAAAVAGLAVLVLLQAPGGALAQGGDQPGVVLTATAAVEDLVETTPVLGQVVATVESEVATRTAGVVERTLFQVGDRVEQGGVLARLDTDLIRIRRDSAAAALEVARAGIDVAQAQLRRAEQGYERQEGLQGSTAFSKAQFEDLRESVSEARSVLARARAEAGQAEAELARADYDLRNATIRAPFSGVVTERHAQPGAYVGLGARIATLLDPDSLEIVVDMPVRLVPALEEGLEVTGRFERGPEVTARLRSVLPVEAISTRTRPVRFALDTGTLDALRLASGKSVTLEIPVSAPRKALTIPKDALVQSGGGWTVYTVENGKARPRDVGIGQPSGQRIEVTSGLLPGDVVVVRGNERLRPGQAVTPRPADGAAETAAAPRKQG